MSSKEFKVGDKLRVVEPSNATQNRLPRGAIVTVIGVDEGWLNVQFDTGEKQYGWHKQRFELVEGGAKFKVGDKVVLKDTAKKLGCNKVLVCGIFNGPYKVSKVHADGRINITDSDNLGLSHGFLADHFEAAPTKPSKTWIVISRSHDGHLTPASYPHEHATKAAAEDEAKRLSKLHHDVSFCVFEARSATSTAKPVEPETTVVSL